MSDVRLSRSFSADPETVFEFITQTKHLLNWWGPEGMHVPDHNLSFTKTGPWFSVMESSEGKKFKVSGQVTSVNPPHSVGFTWAWHDENDVRGDESHVQLEVKANGSGGTDFVLNHRELVNEEAAAAHKDGWVSTLVKLEKLAG